MISYDWIRIVGGHAQQRVDPRWEGLRKVGLKPCTTPRDAPNKTPAIKKVKQTSVMERNNEYSKQD